MQDNDQELRELRGKVDEMAEELARREKQIESLKKTNKIQEQHIELQRRKLVDSENKKPSMVIPEDESAKEEIKKLKEKLEAVEKENSNYERTVIEKQRDFNELRSEFISLQSKSKSEASKLQNLEEQNKKLSSQLRKVSSSGDNEKKLKELRDQFTKKSNQVNKLLEDMKKKDDDIKRLSSDLRKRDEQNKRKDEESSRLRQELRRVQFERSELKKTNKAEEHQITDQSKSNIYEEQYSLGNTYDFYKKEEPQSASFEQSQKWIDEPFFSSGNVVPKVTFTPVPLSMSMNEQNFRVPETHERFFNLIDTYQRAVYPQEKINFLNMTILLLEDYLQKIYNSHDRADS